MALSENPPRPSAHPLAPLRSPATIRARCQAVLRAVEAGVSEHFALERGALPAVARRVAALTLRRFPDLQVPLHSRWRHFEAGGVDRQPRLELALQAAGADAHEAARTRFDLVVVSVLLDAGAGAGWRYQEGDQDLQPGAGPRPPLARSEGLAVASLQAFLQGRFAEAPARPLRADARMLQRVDAALLRAVFQVTASNELVGLDGRAALLARLGTQLQAEARRSGLAPEAARPGLIFDRLWQASAATLAADGSRSVSATALLAEVLNTLGPIWTSGSSVQGLPAGDVWRHRWAGEATDAHGGSDATTGGWVPLHKLSQWLCYSLVEPLQQAGVAVTDLDALTGLPEYRNGGLLIDAGVLRPRRPGALQRRYTPGDDFIVEWRALTVALLDEVAQAVRAELGVTAAQLPLACVLEGGTWAAGREIAAELRAGGAPPLQIDSDGTVF